MALSINRGVARRVRRMRCCNAINARLVELNTTHLEVEDGAISLDAHLAVLGLRIVVEVDPDRPPLVGDSRNLRGSGATRASEASRGPRASRSGLRLVHRRVRHARSEGGEGVAGRVAHLRINSRMSRRENTKAMEALSGTLLALGRLTGPRPFIDGLALAQPPMRNFPGSA
jgi:hypothetical protein